MSCTTAADRCRVTVFQCRSMNTKATTDCRITIGTIMIRSARRGDEAIADAAYRLQEQRIGGIALDLAPQAVDLHVDGALVDGAVAGQGAARHGLAGRDREDAQHLALAVGQVNDLVALAQFAAAEVI